MITMMRMLKSGLTIGMLVTALAMTGGCGDNDNSGNDNGGPNPIRTSTPAAPVRTATPTTGAVTPTPTPTTGAANPTPTATPGIQAFQIQATYPTAKGSFTGTGDSVDCTFTGSGLLTKKDDDSGTLTLSVANSSNLLFPINVECKFDATTAITNTDIIVTVEEVTQNDRPGNKADLGHAVTVSGGIPTQTVDFDFTFLPNG